MQATLKLKCLDNRQATSKRGRGRGYLTREKIVTEKLTRLRQIVITNQVIWDSRMTSRDLFVSGHRARLEAAEEHDVDSSKPEVTYVTFSFTDALQADWLIRNAQITWVLWDVFPSFLLYSYAKSSMCTCSLNWTLSIPQGTFFFRQWSGVFRSQKINYSTYPIMQLIFETLSGCTRCRVGCFYRRVNYVYHIEFVWVMNLFELVWLDLGSNPVLQEMCFRRKVFPQTYCSPSPLDVS